jgi:hypothetical protein
MQITYIGPFDSIDLPTLGVSTRRETPFEVDDLVAEGLIASGDFAAVTTSETPAKPSRSKP